MPYRLWKFRILAELSCRIWWNGFVLPPRVQHSILNDLHRRQVKHSLSLLQQSYAIGKFVEAATEAFLNADDLGSIAEDHPTRLRTQESRRFDNRYWGPMALAAFLGLVLSISEAVSKGVERLRHM